LAVVLESHWPSASSIRAFSNARSTPLLVALNSIPKVALAPLFVIGWVWSGAEGRVALMLRSSDRHRHGARAASVDPTCCHLARVSKASPWRC